MKTKNINEIKDKILNSKISNDNKKRLLAAIMATVMMTSVSGCSKNDNDLYNKVTMEECIIAISDVTLLDDYLINSDFNELNIKYIKARKLKDLNTIKEVLPKLRKLILEGLLYDEFTKQGYNVKDINVVEYEKDGKTRCIITYDKNTEEILPGNIKTTSSEEVCDQFDITCNKFIGDGKISLELADEVYLDLLKLINKNAKIKRHNISFEDSEMKENKIREIVYPNLTKETNKK